jgi:hypothetical protein
MPSKADIKSKGFPCDPDVCAKGGASRHLKPNLFKMYNLMIAFGKKWEIRNDGKLVFSASIVPVVCNFYPCSPNEASRLIKKLCDLGWIIPCGGGRDPITGQKRPNKYQIVLHDQFIKNHPGSCPPYRFAPDYKTAEVHGKKRRGQKFAHGKTPLQFIKLRITPEDLRFGEAVRKLNDPWLAEIYSFGNQVKNWWDNLDDAGKEYYNAEMQKAREALKTKPTLPHKRGDGLGHNN